MSELDMIITAFFINIVYTAISFWQISRIGYEVHKILEMLKEQNNEH